MVKRTEEKKHLSAKGLLDSVWSVFCKIKDSKKDKGGKSYKISTADCLMSGLAIFGLKFSSLLQFDQEKDEEAIRHNLHTLYHIKNAPCDTYLRERIDHINPNNIRKAFTKVFSSLQRGKYLEKYAFLDGHYLLLSDGTGYFSSHNIHCDNCCKKEHRDGKVTYYHMMLGSAIVHPDYKEVIPLCPEPIMKADGAKKNDCERNACKRMLSDLRREHPHLPLILVEDSLSANAPHLRLCQKYNIRFITVVKPNGNKTLFEWLKGIKLKESKTYDTKGNCIKKMCFYNGVPLNNADPDLEVNFIECWEYDAEGNQTYHNTWVTDIEVTKENIYLIAKGGRARWKIENETFNTLKNQGYNFEHNYGHGYKYLSTNFAMLMMLAFLIDQVQQMCCPLFQGALKKLKSKKTFWERLRSVFIIFRINSWKSLYEGIVYGLVKNLWEPDTS